MRRILHGLLTLSFILAVVSSQAQLDPEKLMQFDELKGTPIRDILPDREGNIWIATQSGLIKFDGYNYTRYHPDLNDSTTMGELLTYTLFEDRQGHIWIGGQGAVYRYNPKFDSFTRFLFQNLTGIEPGNPSNITDIASNNRGRIYFGVVSQYEEDVTTGLFYYDEDKKAMFSYNLSGGIDLSSVFVMTADPFDNIWIIGNTGFYKLDSLNKLIQVDPCHEGDCLEENEYIIGMTADSAGILWLASSNANIYTYDPVKNEIKGILSEIPLAESLYNYYGDILIDKNQDIWLTSSQGLLHYSLQKTVFEMFDPGSTDRLLRDLTTSLAFDAFGNLWIGTESMGLLKYNPRSLLNSFVWDDNDPSTLTSGWVKQMMEDEKDEVWIATVAAQNAGISKVDLKNKEVYPTPYSKISTDFFWNDIYVGILRGKMLIRSNRGYKLLDYRNMSIKDTALTGLSDSIYVADILRDSRGNLWFCTYAGLFKQPAHSDQKTNLDLTKIPGTDAASNNVTNIFESPGNGLWILTDNGLFLYDYNTGSITRHGYDPVKGQAFPSQDINSFYQGPDGTCWVGTWQGGLCRYNPETGEIKTYTTNEGLPSMSIQGILADEEHGALWLSTFAGISRFEIDDERFNNFSLKDGIQGLLYADGQYLKTSSGYFLFGGNNGITFFKPQDIAENALPPVTYITRFNVGDRSYSIGPEKEQKADHPEFNLSHSENNISIDYTGIQYDDPAKNKFAYMLENYDKSWREVGNQRSAYYYNLPPGRYNFKVKSANSHGVWNKEPVALNFRIRPPWWRTWLAYVMYGFILVSVFVAFDRIQRRRLLEKERRLARDKELAQAREIEKAYEELKSTQKQLIHAEKMASLGELTAGIAHEIQNPLNFVNNFSEVSAELVDEMKQELAVGGWQSAAEIADDIRQNLQKINHHGRRADAIVKSMLQHSRTTNGQKVPTDLNALADEYLRLSYHGLRAKDKSFNADFRLEAEENLPLVNVVPQDIGRVLLNLINNAFYAVSEKASKNITGYKPEVTVSTRMDENNIVIRVVDNGNGFPEELKEKIFQPFFTTKPTGEGTGLGLSMSYDIITKGHGGELRVETRQGEGTEFIIVLPITTSA